MGARVSWLWLYKKSMSIGEPVLRSLLHSRARKGKENPARLGERQGIAGRPRPDGTLIWFHAASVGEAQSMLTLIQMILEQIPQVHILVTSVTTTSAQLLEERLSAPRAFHQYIPVDHPDWVRSFLDHWQPDIALWAESELWPNTLTLLKKRNIPVALLNAHMSEKSFRNWSRAPRTAEDMLSVFSVILAQSEQDAEYYRKLGGRSIVVTDNLKYGAAPLPYLPADLQALKDSIGSRPVWIYASTHDGEEALACQIHHKLQAQFPNLLTIIAPRHPARSAEIQAVIGDHDLTFTARGPEKRLPVTADQIYLADTLGEMGLLYRAAPMTCMGRSFSKDGGGGHNPIEPAILKSAVITGPHTQNFTGIYEEMVRAGAAYQIQTPEELGHKIATLLSDPETLRSLQESGYSFAALKARSLTLIAEELEPLFILAHLPVLKARA